MKAAAAKEPGLEREAVDRAVRDLSRARRTTAATRSRSTRDARPGPRDDWKRRRTVVQACGARRRRAGLRPPDDVPAAERSASRRSSTTCRPRCRRASSGPPPGAARDDGAASGIDHRGHDARVIRSSSASRTIRAGRRATGERVWLAGPSFMLVFPKGDRVELVYDGGPPVTLGGARDLIGWRSSSLLAVLPVGGSARALAAAGRARSAMPDRCARWSAWVRRSGSVVDRARATRCWRARWRSSSACYAAAAVALRGHRRRLALPPRRSSSTGPASSTRPCRCSSRRSGWRRSRPPPSTRPTSRRSSCFRKDDWARLRGGLPAPARSLPGGAVGGRVDVPSRALPRAARRAGRRAVAAWREAQARFPDTPWAKYAGERLAELKP